MRWQRRDEKKVQNPKDYRVRSRLDQRTEDREELPDHRSRPLAAQVERARQFERVLPNEFGAEPEIKSVLEQKPPLDRTK